MAGRVFVAGSANIDLVATVSRLPSAGETVLADSFDALPGGKGVNQAIAAAKAGASVMMFGCVGRDSFGDTLIAVLASAGVDVSSMGRSVKSTGTALISVDGMGRNQIVVFPGANADLQFSDLLRQGNRADVLICQNECPVDVVLEYFGAAKIRHLTTILNAAPVVKLPRRLLELVDVLVVNEEEAKLYGDQPLEGDVHVEAMPLLARRLRVRSEQTIVITLGENGVMALAGDDVFRLPGHKVKAVDTTGAGDCFCGYLAASLADGQSILDGMKLANAAAALAVQRRGAAVAMPDLAEVLVSQKR